MKLSRTDLIPVLAIVAGGVIGASLSFSFLGGSRSDDVLFIAVPAVAPSVAVESAPQRTDLSPNLEVVRGSGEVSQPHWVLIGARVEVDGMVLTGDRIEVYVDGDGMLLAGDKREAKLVVTEGSIRREGGPVVTSTRFEIRVIDLDGAKIEADEMVLSPVVSSYETVEVLRTRR